MDENLIAELDINERKLFLKALLLLIKIDGRVDDRERELAHELVNIYNVSELDENFKQSLTRESLLNEIKSSIKERKKALLLLQELLIVAHIDDDFDEKEMLFIEDLAHVLNIDDDVVLQLNQLILDYKLLQMRKRKIMEG